MLGLFQLGIGCENAAGDIRASSMLLTSPTVAIRSSGIPLCRVPRTRRVPGAAGSSADLNPSDDRLRRCRRSNAWSFVGRTHRGRNRIVRRPDRCGRELVELWSPNRCASRITMTVAFGMLDSEPQSRRRHQAAFKPPIRGIRQEPDPFSSPASARASIPIVQIRQYPCVPILGAWKWPTSVIAVRENSLMTGHTTKGSAAPCDFPRTSSHTPPLLDVVTGHYRNPSRRQIPSMHA